jgi:uncharacterized protein YbjT (DUF2867 family)
MRVAIAGGHGKIALRLATMLTNRGDEVRSLIRAADQEQDVRASGAEPVLCDLESTTEEQVAEAVGSVDAVVFAAGAGPGSGPERKESMDYGGAVKLIEAARINGIARYVIVSARGADPSASGDDTFAAYARAKGRADAELVASGLEYTVVRPTRLTEDPGTGQVEIADRVAGDRISRDDVAAVLAATLHEPGTAAKTFQLASGDMPVEEAVSSLARV